MSKAIRVLVVDDSALMRKLIPKILESEGSIEVVGTAMDGEFALKKIEELKPDVVTLDLEMPRLDGIETLRAITHSHHVPVIVVSTHTKAGAYSTFKALALGARAVLVGRPVLWGLAVDGARGVQHVLEILHAELERAMKLSGCPTLASVNRSLVKLT